MNITTAILIAIVVIVIVMILYYVLLYPSTLRGLYREQMERGDDPGVVIDTINRIRDLAATELVHRGNNWRMLAHREANENMANRFINFARRDIETAMATATNNEFNQLDDLYVIVQLMDIGTAPHIGPIADQINKASTAEMAKRVAERTETRSEFVEEFTSESAKIRSDSQNVHDTTFNSEMRLVIDELMKLNTMLPKEAIREAREACQHNSPALNALRTIEMGHKISVYGTSEDIIFASVWSRIRQNKTRSDDIRAAIINALADCYEHGILVCINGRVGRIVGALTMLDSNDVIRGGASTTDLYKNQIFGEVRDLIKTAPLISNDPDVKIVAASYDDPNIETTAEMENKFNKYMRGVIDTHLEQYKNKLSEHSFKFIREGCHAALL
jgi:hypothetical protein